MVSIKICRTCLTEIVRSIVLGFLSGRARRGICFHTLRVRAALTKEQHGC
jgi:hypothetical protein